MRQILDGFRVRPAPPGGGGELCPGWIAELEGIGQGPTIDADNGDGAPAEGDGGSGGTEANPPGTGETSSEPNPWAKPLPEEDPPRGTWTAGTGTPLEPVHRPDTDNPMPPAGPWPKSTLVRRSDCPHHP